MLLVYIQKSGNTVYKFGELPSNNLGVYAVKTRNFSAIRPQFDDDLHSSRLRFEMDWKIAIFIAAEQSKIIFVHLVDIW